MPAIRLLPIVLIATSSLLALKVTGIVTAGGYTLVGLYDTQEASVSEIVTGSVGGDRPGAAPATAAGKPATGAGAVSPQNGTAVRVDDRPQVPAGERAVLERLQQRRQELDERSRELDMREGLLKAAEKRLEARIEELKKLESGVKAAEQKKDESEAARLKSLITMYENMKPKEAARIFDRLDLKVLIDVASQLNPRRMSDILAQMTPEAAERLTVELAARANGAPRPVSVDHLPKIQGRPRS
jgi:flagellar motility protein MotE (MotC chaperone)